MINPLVMQDLTYKKYKKKYTDLKEIIGGMDFLFDKNTEIEYPGEAGGLMISQIGVVLENTEF